MEDREKSLKLLAGHDYFGGGTFTKEETVSLIPYHSPLIQFAQIYFACIVLNEIYFSCTFAIDQTGGDGEKSSQ